MSRRDSETARERRRKLAVGMMSSRRVLVVAALGSASLAASLIACLIDTGGLAGEPLVDGASEANGDSAASDGAASDADAGASLDATACVVTDGHFCDDFDELPLGGRWESRSETRGHVTFDGVGLSPPRAMQAVVIPGSGNASAGLAQHLSLSIPTKTHCQYDLHLDSVPAEGEIDILDMLTVTPDAGDHHAYIARFDGTWSVAEYETALDGGVLIDREQAIGFDLEAGTWHHLVIDYTATSLNVSFDGLPARISQLTVPTTGARVLSIGITYASSNIQDAGLLVDNVDCITTP